MMTLTRFLISDRSMLPVQTTSPSRLFEPQSYDEFRIPVHRNVRIVRGNNDLTGEFPPSQQIHDDRIDVLVVEVVLGLVDDDGLITSREQKAQDGCALLPD